MIGAFSKREVEPLYQWRNDYGETWRLLSSKDWRAKKKLSAIWKVLFVAICVPAESSLRVQGELLRSLVQVVRLVEGGNLQFLLPKVALPSKLFARATWGPIKGGLQSFCHDPTWRELLQRAHKSMHIFSLLLIIRVNEIHCPMCLTNNALEQYALNKRCALIRRALNNQTLRY